MLANHNPRPNQQYNISKVYYPTENIYRPVYILHAQNKYPVQDGLLMLSQPINSRLSKMAKETFLDFVWREF